MKLDPITLEILGNKLTAIAEEMCLTLQRTGRTLYVKETADFCCALVGLDGRFFAYPRALGVSGFVGLDCTATLAAARERYGDLEPGDVILTNDPARSGGLATHLPDLHILEPFFHDGEIVAYGWGFLHASDVGGKVPSSISPTNHEIYQEGLQIPPVKIMRAGELNEDVAALLRANSRTPEANMGDLRAMIGAVGTGRERLRQTIAQHGVAALLDVQRDLVEYAARRGSAVLAKVPEGTYRFSDFLDDEAGSGAPVRIALAVTLADGRIHLDFTGSDPQVAAAINIPSHGRPHAWLTLRVLALMVTLDPGIPINGGLLAPIDVTAPKGSLVNPLPNAAVGVRHAAAVRVNDALNGVLGQALPETMPAASGGTIIPVVIAEPARHGGGQNVQVVEPMVGGTGGRAGFDGADGRDSSISNLSNNPVETVEAETELEIVRYGLREDSAGPGQWRGGSGQMLRFRIRGAQGHVLARGMERLTFRPWGSQGGGAGEPARLELHRAGEAPRSLGKIDMLAVAENDEIALYTPGGGGWGHPFDREPEAVLADVRRGLVSRDAARRDYGVAVIADASGRASVDDAETEALRRDRPTPSALGTERERWDAVFSPARLDRLHHALFALPAVQRRTSRQAVLDAALAELPSAFPREGAIDDALAHAASRFDAALISLEATLANPAADLGDLSTSTRSS
ncbi:hydantoinase B/oxoprolinase family protein [Salinicola avicenniae]|uniref:hydantoinase B/oxoprolinase family protein n=1 Tax=Salinicola avicenniae TaxID=2916836 RepID=UPI0020748D7A|nr:MULTISPECIES: hydantoinase B/oxoprolinase family protein [unclassified Salinicola]